MYFFQEKDKWSCGRLLKSVLFFTHFNNSPEEKERKLVTIVCGDGEIRPKRGVMRGEEARELLGFSLRSHLTSSKVLITNFLTSCPFVLNLKLLMNTLAPVIVSREMMVI